MKSCYFQGGDWTGSEGCHDLEVGGAVTRTCWCSTDLCNGDGGGGGENSAARNGLAISLLLLSVTVLVAFTTTKAG